jgi:hypothetical protein
MEPLMEPITEPIHIPGRISGAAIIDDLCDRIAERLAHDCSLRATDAYSGYSARVQIELQLHDVYPTEVAATVKVGEINSQLPSAHIDLGGEVVAEPESGNLERSIDPDGSLPEAATAAAKERRYYTPRSTKPLPLTSHG